MQLPILGGCHMSHIGGRVENFTASNPSIDPKKRVPNNVSEPEVLSDFLRLFAGQQKSIRRSSGGLVAAEPYQIVAVRTELPARTSIRLRVRFKDITIEEA